MKFSIALKNLPFMPEHGQVVYVEGMYDETINAFISRNYLIIRERFRLLDKEFVYLPLYFDEEEVARNVRYYAPYLNAKIIEGAKLRSGFLLNFLVHPADRETIGASLLLNPQRVGANWVFEGYKLELTGDDKRDVNEWVTEVCCSRLFEKDCIVQESVSHHSHCIHEERKTIRSKRFFSRFVDKIQGELFDDDSNFVGSNSCEKLSTVSVERDEVAEIMASLNDAVKQLRLRGVALGAIHEFIDSQEPISPLVITEDLRLFLPVYNNIEIELSAQKKALYFLFLNHPEGIVLQHLEDYHNELMNYYKQTNNGKVTPRMEESIKKLEVYGNNQLNVVITRIREAFCSKFDERLARHYIICGEKGQPYKIGLSQELISWEE